MSTIINALKSNLPEGAILTGESLKERYYHIWKMGEPLRAKAYLLPRSTEEVSKICSICFEHNQKVIVFGGLTNLVGSTETEGDEIIISMEKLNQIEELDDRSRTMTVQSGVILQKIHEVANAKDLMFPLNFGARGTAQIGGCIATNAGGLRVLKFGMTRAQILGLEVVLMDGTVLSSMKKIIKDNSAYDLKQLFIGSEGTLGIITKAVLKLREAPKARSSAFLGFNHYEKVVDFLKYIDRGMGGSLSGFEVIWKDSYKVMTGPDSSRKPVLDYSYKYYVLVESLGADHELEHSKLQNLIEKTIEEGRAEDAVLAHSEADLEWFWTIREDVKVLAEQTKFDQHFDVSVPINRMGSYVDSVLEKLQASEDVHNAYAFGHLADGNVHFIVAKHNSSDELRLWINDIVYSPLEEMGGSVSAEHGIGLHKKEYLKLCRTKEEIDTMKMLKRNFDPKGLLNKGKVLDV